MLDILDSMRLLYPGLISAKQPIDTFHTIEGRPIYWVRVSNNPTIEQPLKPQMLYTSMHHAREPGSMAANIYYLWYLLENYATDLQVKTIIDNTELYFIPCVNPDGYIYNITSSPGGGGLWRKNRRDNMDGTYGVDLNRNYGKFWAFDATGSSPVSMSETYRGAAAFSEPETRAVKWFCDNHHFRFALNYHTYQDATIYPWGHIQYFQAPDSTLHRTFWHHLTLHNHYYYGTTIQTVGYIGNGGSDDWMYGDTGTKPKIFAFTPEIGDPAWGFYPPTSEIIPNCHNNLYPNITMASFLLPFAAITPSDDKILTASTGYLHYSLQRLGFADTATYTVSMLPLDGWLTVSTTPKTHSGLALLQEVTDSISYSIASSTPNGQLIRYVVQAYNGQYYLRDTVSCYYSKFNRTFTPSTSSLSDWINTDWGLSSTEYHTPPACIHSAPTGMDNYPDGAYCTLQTATPIDLTHATKAYLHFYTKFMSENKSDYCQVSAATAGGAGAFIPLCGKYSKPLYTLGDQPVYDGEHPNWVLEEIDLNDYLGQQINIQFAFSSDMNHTNKGFFFDDFRVVTIQDSTQDVPSINNGATIITTYPNPATEQLTILIPNHKPGTTLQATLYDCLGRTAMHASITTPTTSLNISHLPSGIYCLKVNDNTTTLPVQKVNIIK